MGSTNTLKLTAGRSAKGGAGVLEAVKATPGAIGYDELGAAQKAGLGIAELLNGSGKSVAPNAASIAEALDKAQWAKDVNSADLDGSAGPGSCPMTAVPYALIPVAVKISRNSALPFLQTEVAQGDAQVRLDGFSPLPAVAKTLAGGVR